MKTQNKEEEIFSVEELEELKEKRKLSEQIDSLCQKLYEQEIDIVYFGYENFNIEKLKDIIKELEKKLVALRKAEEGTKGRYKLKHYWREYYDKIIIRQSLYRDLYFYALLGQTFFHDYKIISLYKDEDLRIHPVLIGPTGIGKSESNTILAEVLELIPKRRYINEEGNEVVDNFKTVFPKKLTDTALVGSFDSTLHKEQVRKRINSNDERWIDPRQWGYFHDYDFIIFDEAEIIFKPGKWSSELQPLLRGVMNRYGTKPNHISNDSISSKGWIEYFASCSIILTSYYMLEFEAVFMQGGLMQRTALVVDEEDPDKRNDIQNIQIDNVQDKEDPEFEKRKKDFEELRNKFTSLLIKLKMKNMKFTEEEWSSEKRIMISFPKKIRDKIKKYKNEIKNILPLSISQKEKFDSALSRLVQTFFKVCALNTIIEEREKVNEEDVDEAFLLIRQLAISLAEFIKLHSRKAEEEIYGKMEMEVIKILTKKELTKGDLNTYMSTLWGVSLPTTITRLKKIKQQGIFAETTVGEGNQKICKLKEGVKLY